VSGTARSKILVVGTGGQGVLTAARHLGETARRCDLDVVLGQLHGMSQRGGSVESTVLIGYTGSSFIEEAEADVVLGLEPLEALRARPRMRPSTVVITSTRPVVPQILSQTGEPYPELDSILAKLRAVAAEVIAIDGGRIIEEVGARRSLNIAMIGALVGRGLLPFDAEALWETIAASSPERYLEANRRAFELGVAAVVGQGSGGTNP